MYQILFILVVLLFSFSIAAAQKTDENLSKPDSAKQTNYSESTPYQPRKLDFPVSKKKKEKKSKKAAVEKKTTQPEISSKVTNGNKTISIPMFVYDRTGKPVTDLQKSDIKIFVDEREAEISVFETANPSRNILLILDTSPSLAFKENDLKNVVSKLIEALEPGDKLQIIIFNQNVEVLNEPTNDAKILQKAVRKIQMGSGTSIYDSIQTIYKKYLDTSAEPPVMILLTDGVDTTSQKANFMTSLVEAEKSGVAVFPFYFDSADYFQKNNPTVPVSIFGLNRSRSAGLTKAEYELGRAYLHDIAALSGGRTFVIKNLTEIKKEDFEAAFKFLNPQYYIAVNRAETAAAFERKQIKVRVNRPNLIIQARGSCLIGEN